MNVYLLSLEKVKPTKGRWLPANSCRERKGEGGGEEIEGREKGGGEREEGEGRRGEKEEER